MAEEEKSQIFLDKIKLAARLVDKEMVVNNNINTLIRMKRSGVLEIESLSRYNEFHVAWQSLSELYDFLKNDYKAKLEKEELESVNKIIDKYMTSNSQMTFEELISAYETVLKMMSLSGFHDLFRAKDIEATFESEET